jgi:tetratricopeptide (TPR) repeat protein
MDEKKVIVREETVFIPTYETGEYNKNPMFLEKRVYQGSSGRVYPHPVCESISDEKKDKPYKAVFLENDYILVMILPELGGRIQRLYDKTNGYDAVYYNEVVKPALVGLAGPWISGGIEFNWPQHHRPSTFDPVQYTVEKHEDGSVTVWTGETEKMFHTKGAAGFTVYPDAAYLEITGRVYNPTEEPQTFLWWANPAVAVNDFTRSIFPPDVNAVFDHGKRDVSEFPIAKGVYYKVNYAPGTDISRYKNIPVPTSYMAHHSDYDFIGNYDDSKEAGLLHVADHHVSPGKKQWTWGNGDFGRAWDRNLTDENGPYIELMTGVFTDNQPDFTFLKPFEEKTFTQYFMPYKKCGAVKNATKALALNIENAGDGAKVTVYATEPAAGMLTLEVFDETGVKQSETFEIKTAEYREFKANGIDAGKQGSGARILADGREILAYVNRPVDTPVPEPASPMPEPEKVPTNEELFLFGTHLEQYRHATFKPEDYYLEGLKRDATDIRINNAYGKLIYKKGRFEESIKYFEAAIKKMTLRNPNPYDCEAYFNLGLACRRTGDLDKAFDAFYKATWDGNFRDKGFYELACLEALRAALDNGEAYTATALCGNKNSCHGSYEKALEYVSTSLVFGAHNFKARTLKTALLRKLGRNEEARAFAEETKALEPLDMGARYELSALKGCECWKKLMRPDNADFEELAIAYEAAGLFDDAVNILTAAPAEEPLVLYRLYAITGDREYLERAEKASSLYCFPNRIDHIPVLGKAVKDGGKMAAYYLGCLLYDKGEWQEAVKLWESVEDDISLPTVHRNLSLAYYNKLKDQDRARRAMEKAFSMDTTDARVFFELDSLYKALDRDVAERLAFLEDHAELLESRDDLYTEYISLLNKADRFDEAFDRIQGHKFHPWEGGEGKITAEYRIALMKKAAAVSIPEEKAAKEAVKALLVKALTYPENLGEGKLIGALDNDIYWLLACAESDPAQKKEYLELAARGETNFTSAMYYNDQPPEMMYYRALALNGLGKKEEAQKIGKGMIDYGKTHENDEVKIDFFAVSLPDFLIFEADLNKKNRLHCENMKNLGEKILSVTGDA